MFKLYDINSFYVGAVLRRDLSVNHDRGIIGYFSDGDALIKYYDRALLFKSGDEYINISEVSSQRELEKIIQNKNGKYNHMRMKVLSGLERYSIDCSTKCVDGKVTDIVNNNSVNGNISADSKNRISFQKAKKLSRRVEIISSFGIPSQN